MLEIVLAVGSPLRKFLGFYYRFARQYMVNCKVYQQLIDLSHLPVSYYSVLLQDEIAESKVLEQVEAGDVIIVKDLLGQLQLYPQLEAITQQFFNLNYQQLSDIHQLKSVEQVVNDALAVRHALPTLVLQSSIMRRLLAPHVNKQYLELQPNLRLHLPYGKIKQHEQYIESRMGRGKLNPHGQHKDSWRYHPSNTINVWVALSEANDKNGLSLLPQSADYMPKFDAALQEIAQGVKTYPSQQYVTDLKLGDALIFQAELVHGSIINMTNQTRVALSMRCAPSEPNFHQRVTYNYIKVGDGGFDNLSRSKLKATGAFEPLSRDTEFAFSEAKQTSIKPIRYDDQQIELEVEGQIKVFPRYCAHAGTDMLNGELDANGQLLCPSHRMCIKGKCKS